MWSTTHRLEISLGDILRDAERGRIGPKWFALQDKEGNATGGNLCMQLNVQLLASSQVLLALLPLLISYLLFLSPELILVMFFFIGLAQVKGDKA
jgi:hypothetical protein